MGKEDQGQLDEYVDDRLEQGKSPKELAARLEAKRWPASIIIATILPRLRKERWYYFIAGTLAGIGTTIISQNILILAGFA